jgi:Na+-driven multidrug efflux pump
LCYDLCDAELVYRCWVFGEGVEQGAYYVGLAVATLWITAVTSVVDAYFRARKASPFVVGIGVLRLLINIALNIVFVVGYGMGVAGVLWGNLLSAVVGAIVECTPFVVTHRAISFDVEIARGYWSFGAPLIVYGLCSTIMHEADRFVTSGFRQPARSGTVYSLAYSDWPGRQYAGHGFPSLRSGAW